MEDLQEPKTPKKFPYVLDESEVGQLLEAAKKYTDKWTVIGDYTMVLLLLDERFRATEILEAKKENLNLERRLLKVHGKGTKDRNVFFGTQACRWLKKWLQVREDISNPVVEEILERRIKSRLEEILPNPESFAKHKSWGYYISTGLDDLKRIELILEESGEDYGLSVSCHFGDTMSQSRSFYENDRLTMDEIGRKGGNSRRTSR